MIAGDAKSHTLVPSLSVVVAVGAAGLVLPLDPALKFTLIAAMGWAIAAVGLDLLVGYTGQLSFGQAAFVGVGAYAVTSLRIELDLGLVAAIVAALLITGLFAALLARVMVRLALFGFAITTLFFGYVAVTLLTSDTLASLLGGASGLQVPAFPFGGSPFTGSPGLFAFAAVALALVVVLTCHLVDSQTGRALRLIKSNDVVAAACGVRVKRMKAFAFTYCCVLGAFGGVIYSAAVGYLSPDSFALHQSVYIFAMVIVGGAGTVGGPVLGALIITVLPGYLLRDGEISAVLFAAAILVFLIALPGGLYGLGARLLAPLGALLPRRRKAEPDTDRAPAPHAPARAERRPPPGHRADAPALEVQGLEMRFGDFVALSEVDLTVRPATVHAVVGPNGAGKTTLLNAISGLYTPTQGEVRLFGSPIRGLDPIAVRDHGVIRTFQTPTVVPDLDVVDNVKLGLDADHPSALWRHLLGPVATARRERMLDEQAHWALDAVGIAAERRRSQVGGLDLSEQKRVELARGLAGQGVMLLLDEPTAGLSVGEMERLGDLLTDVRERFDLSVLVISHHIGFITRIADDLTVLDQGRVAGHGEPAEVLARPAIAETFAGITAVEAPVAPGTH